MTQIRTWARRSNSLKLAGLAAAIVAISSYPQTPGASAHNPMSAWAQQRAAAAMCGTSAQPNLGTIAGSITQSPNGPFISDYNKLSQAAWCTLIALNFPASGTAPNIPPTMAGSGTFGNCAAPAANCPTVWETWLETNEVYCKNGAQPDPNKGCPGATPHSAMAHNLRVGFNGAGEAPAAAAVQELQKLKGPVRGTRPMVTSSAGGHTTTTVQATGFELPDKNYTAASKTFISYEARDNPGTVEYLIKDDLYSADGQLALYNKLKLKTATTGAPPAQGVPAGVTPTPVDFPPTAFEIKPSWYTFTASDNNAQLGMFTATGPKGTTIGLTGFHILWKVFPKSNWFWATFQYENKTNPTYNNAYLAPLLKTAMTPPAPTNQSVGPYVPYDGPDMITAAAAAANAIFRPLMGTTVFANYRLVGVQVAGDTPDNKPSLLANDHMETDFGAKSVAGAAYPMSSSCVTCHYNASVGSDNTTGCSPTAKNKGPAYFRRVPLYKTDETSTALPTGFTGAFQPPLYNSNASSHGAFLSMDFVWSMQNAQWKNGTGCPATAAK